jgi:hypothetical protein
VIGYEIPELAPATVQVAVAPPPEASTKGEGTAVVLAKAPEVRTSGTLLKVMEAMVTAFGD